MWDILDVRGTNWIHTVFATAMSFVTIASMPRGRNRRGGRSLVPAKSEATGHILSSSYWHRS